MKEKFYKQRVAVALVFPNGAKALGVGVVTGERWDGATTITLPAQFVHISVGGEVVEEWPAPTGKPPRDGQETMAVGALDMFIREPLEEWPDADPLPVPGQAPMYGVKARKWRK